MSSELNAPEKTCFFRVRCMVEWSLSGGLLFALITQLAATKESCRMTDPKIQCISNLNIGINCLASRAVVRLFRPPRFRWCGQPVSILLHKILLMHHCDTPDIRASSRYEYRPADNLTIITSICSCKLRSMIPQGIIEHGNWFSNTRSI